jgi:hypothetical protein
VVYGIGHGITPSAWDHYTTSGYAEGRAARTKTAALVPARASGIPFIGPFIDQISAATGISPMWILLGGGLFGAWALGIFDGGGQRR